VLAYECGYSESLVREEMGVRAVPDSGDEERMAERLEAEECVLAVALIWITLGMLPKETSRRWSRGAYSLKCEAAMLDSRLWKSLSDCRSSVHLPVRCYEKGRRTGEESKFRV